MKRRERGPVGVANQRLRVGGRSGRCIVVRNQIRDALSREVSYSGQDLALPRSRRVKLSFYEEEISSQT